MRRILCTVGVLASMVCPRVALAQGYAFPPVQCESIDLESEQGTCVDDQCVLSDQVRMRCNNLVVMADDMVITMGADREFGGAVATGNVWLASGSTVVQCTKVTLGADQIQGHVGQAIVHLKEGPVNLAADDRSKAQFGGGRDRFVMWGELERLKDDRLVMHNSDFSMCDCGEKRPSWRLSSPKIVVVPNDRATVWWPIFKIRPFGLFDMPLTPPLLPLSVPLKSRQMGLLAPRIALFNSLWPTIDVPFFIPLGKSWDIAIIPGLRMDWAEHPHANPLTWGSPRMGGRLRYAPYLGETWSLEGKINVQWTHDGDHWAAKKRQVLALQAPPYNEKDPSWGLRERFSWNIDQQLKAGKSFAWTVRSEWYSDDLIPQDFAMPLAERSRNYIASRTQALWRHPGLLARAAADYYLQLDTIGFSPECTEEQKTDGSCPKVTAPSNWGSTGKNDPHRGPWLGLHMLPRRLGQGFHVDGQVSYVRYGPWAIGASPAVNTEQNLMNAVAGITYADAFGPVHVQARTGVDGLLADPKTDLVANMIGTVSAEANMSWIGRTNTLGLVITPRIGYRAMPWNVGTIPETASLDERWQRDTRFHQMMMAFDQEFWWRTAEGRWARFATLSLTQPLDMQTGDLLPPWVSLEWNAGKFGNGAVSTSMDWATLDQPSEIPRSIAARLSLPIGPFVFTTNYARLAANATQFLGSIYQFAPARGTTLTPGQAISYDPIDSTWVHYLTGDVAINWPKSVSLGYSMVSLLPLPGRDEGRADCAPSLTGPSNPPYPNACVAAHTVRALYRSPCNCWEIGANFTKTTVDYRIGFTIGAGGYSLGTTMGPTR